MNTWPGDALDTRLVFRIYGWTAIVTGIAVSEWPNLGAADFAQKLQPAATVAGFFGIYAVPRIMGYAVVAAGVSALGMAAVDDPADRRRCLTRFAIAHLVFGWVFFAVTHAILGEFFPSLLSWVPLIVGAVLTYLALTASSLRLSLIPPRVAVQGQHARVIVDRAVRRVDPLRTQYQEQIRRAAQQEERTRLARDLHDAVKQQLFVVQTAAATAEERLAADAEGARTALYEVRTASREAIAEMQAMIDNLQAEPLENFGLVESLRTQCEALRSRTGADVRLEVGELPPSEALGPGGQQTLFRFAQEALANVGRHARAQHVVVRLGLEQETFTLTVQDDGVGFDATEWGPGMGRRNMIGRASELGGTLMIQSERGRGTTVRCVIRVPRRTPGRYMARAAISAAIAAGMLPIIFTGSLDHYDSVRAAALAVAAAAIVSALRFFAARQRLRARAAA